MTMKELLLSVVLLLAVGGCCARPAARSQAEQDSQALFPPSSAKQTLVPVFHVMGDCRFHIKPLYGGEFEVHSGSSPPQGAYSVYNPRDSSAWSVKFACLDGNDKKNIDEVWLSAKQTNSHWLYYDVNDESGSPWGEFDPAQNVEVIQLTGSNWAGWAIATDETTGNESNRGRWLRYCLLHDAEALCGMTEVMKLGRLDTNVLDKVVEVLRTVEFIDTPAPRRPAGYE